MAFGNDTSTSALHNMLGDRYTNIENDLGHRSTTVRFGSLGSDPI